MPPTLPSDRFNSGFKAGSSSDPTRPLNGQELIFIECVNEESREEKVRVAVLADILTDLGFSLEGLTETVILSTAAGGSVTLDIKDGLILSRVYGTGTELDPYLVYTAGDLNNVRLDPDAHYLQMADIDLSGYANWTPIGDGSQAGTFSGSYDGAGFTISNLTCDQSDEAGLFGIVSNCVLKNMVVLDAEISGQMAGILVSQPLAAVITDCSVTGVVSGKTGAASLGLLAGYSVGTTYTRCGARGGVIGVAGASGVGGFIGTSEEGDALTDCYSVAIVSGSGALNAGGMIGMSICGLILVNCYAGGTVSGGTTNNGLAGVDIGTYMGSVTSGYWDKTINPTLTDPDDHTVPGETTAHLTSGAAEFLTTAPNAWDFTNVWEVQFGVNGGYPTLRRENLSLQVEA